MLPFEVSSTATPLSTSNDIPGEIEDFNIFVPYAVVNSKTKQLKINFRISSELPLWHLKTIPQINQCGIYLDQTYLATTNILVFLCTIKLHGISIEERTSLRSNSAYLSIAIGCTLQDSQIKWSLRLHTSRYHLVQEGEDFWKENYKRSFYTKQANLVLVSYASSRTIPTLLL